MKVGNVFPTPTELKSEEITRKANKFVLKILDAGKKEPLLDFHLLIFIRNRMDSISFKKLCSELKDSIEPAFSSEIKIAFDMLKMMLSNGNDFESD
jgi:hypothetical protein